MRKKDLKGEVRLFDFPGHMKYLHDMKKIRFPYHGVYCFEGKQGSSKTLSACRLISNIFADYKDVYLVTNVWLNTDILTNIPKENIIPFTRYYQLFFNYNKPVIFFIDEAHLLFNSLESKNADVNMFSHCVVYHDFEKQRDELVGKKEFGAWYTHIRKIHYEMYDTYQVINYSKDSEFWNKRKEDDENGYFMEYKKYLKES